MQSQSRSHLKTKFGDYSSKQSDIVRQGIFIFNNGDLAPYTKIQSHARSQKDYLTTKFCDDSLNLCHLSRQVISIFSNSDIDHSDPKIFQSKASTLAMYMLSLVIKAHISLNLHIICGEDSSKHSQRSGSTKRQMDKSIKSVSVK
jgi:uncharacterized metal-binding protein